MRLNSKHTVEELERYIQMYLEDGISIKELSETFGLFTCLLDRGQFIYSEPLLNYSKRPLRILELLTVEGFPAVSLKGSTVSGAIDSFTITLAERFRIPL